MSNLPRFVLIAALGLAVVWLYDYATQPVAVLTSDGYRYEGYTIEPQKPYEMEARVLARKEYSLDRESDVAPLDLALGWGPMSDPEVLAEIDISQRNRFYWWRVSEFPIPRRDIETHSANVHIIAANPAVAAALDDVEPDMMIRLGGQLVNVRADDGWLWRSSLTFNDTGGGACELLWLERLEVL